jgi:four helix bundle protein
VQDDRKLKVREKAHRLTLAVYRATTNFPASELYGLTSQMRRSSSSIPTNIVEGCGRSSTAEFVRFLYVSLGSANELEYQILLARDLGMIAPDVADELSSAAEEIKQMLSGLIASATKSRG